MSGYFTAQIAKMQADDHDVPKVIGWLSMGSPRPDRGKVVAESSTVRNVWLS